MPPEKSNRRLGRGLDALFGTVQTEPQADGLKTVPTSRIASNPFQPRKTFDPAELAELQESLKVNGLLQAVVVRPAPDGSGYQLIAGERRLRAARNLGWEEIPAVVKEMSDRDVLTMALVENLQRHDLSPVEEAEGYGRLIEEFGYTQQTVADIVGKNRSTVANTLRILNLPEEVRGLLDSGKLSAGQARPLLAIDDVSQATTLARRIVRDGLSAREVERLVREAPSKSTRTKSTKPAKPQSAGVTDLERRLRKHLGTDITVSMKSDNRGFLTVSFYSLDDLERLTDLMGLPKNPH